MKAKELVKKGIEYFYKLKDKDKALQCFDEAINNTNSLNIKSYANKGNTLIDLGFQIAGIEFTEKAASLNPHYINIYFIESKAYSLLGNIEKAAKLYNFGANFYINYERDAESYFLQAEALELIRQRSIYLGEEEIETQKEILTYFDRALQIDPAFAAVYPAKAQILIDMERFEEAFKWCEEGLKFRIYNGVLYKDMGRCLYALERAAEAVLYFDIAKELEPKEAKYNYYEGMCLKKLGKDKEAKKAFHKFELLKSKEDSSFDEEDIAILENIERERKFENTPVEEEVAPSLIGNVFYGDI